MLALFMYGVAQHPNYFPSERTPVVVARMVMMAMVMVMDSNNTEGGWPLLCKPGRINWSGMKIMPILFMNVYVLGI